MTRNTVVVITDLPGLLARVADDLTPRVPVLLARMGMPPAPGAIG